MIRVNRVGKLSIVLSVLVLVLAASGKGVANGDDLQRRSMQRDPLTRYLTDVVEVPFDVQTAITETDAKQRTRTHKSRHKFQITSNRSRAEGQATMTAKLRHGLRYPRFHEYDVDQTLLTVVVSLGILESRTTTTLEFGDDSCRPFEAYSNRFRLRNLCGVLRLPESTGQVPEPISIQFVGLPQTFGKRTLLRYSFWQEFQSIPAGGNAVPLILPKRCIGEFEFTDGTLRVESTYIPVL